jgi:Ribosome biogenesis protein SLX9
MGKLIKVQKQKNAPSKDSKKKNDANSLKVKKPKKSHVLKVSKPSTGIRKKILSKKEKQKTKDQKLKQSINKTLLAFEEDKAKKKREKRPIIGDLKPLLDSLPSLDELISIRDSSVKTGIAAIDRRIPKKPRNKKERKVYQLNVKTEAMLDRFDSVQKVWKSKEFQQNPRALIAEKIRQRRVENTANEMEN